ncbi:MAG: tetratricopeptide repeat protein [Paludibacteraceae bacterium]|nr:tetratricopeptide repeat protein [Paludibacteraceae bacterium]
MAKENFKKEDEQLENVGEALNTAGLWIEAHQNLLFGIVIAIAAVILGCIALNNYVIKPHALEASNENAKAVEYFMQGQWETALNGDDAECIGFLAVADEYAMYQQGELANLYAGICYYQLGQYEESAACLKKFSADDVMINPASYQLLGDAYVQMGELEKALKAYDASIKSNNDLLSPMSLKKAGLVYLELDKKANAKKCFEQIRDNYPQSQEAQDIEKYISLAQ